MELGLAGKRVLVTGASRGIGLATVRAFLAEGAEVTAASRTMTPELEATGPAFVSADLATPHGPERMVGAALAADARLDVLVNNAGGGVVPDGVLADPFGGRDEDWEQALALNLFAAVRTTRAALPALAEARGAVVTVGSDSVLKPHTVPLSYAAAKAALHAFSRGLAEHVGGAGVRVNVVTPSSTRTPLITGEDGMAAKVAAATGADRDAVVAGFAERSGMVTGRLVDPAEIARAVVLLASPEMPSAVGSNWAVHAGAVKTPA